jgi:hypothetical protein
MSMNYESRIIYLRERQYTPDTSCLGAGWEFTPTNAQGNDTFYETRGTLVGPVSTNNTNLRNTWDHVSVHVQRAQDEHGKEIRHIMVKGAIHGGIENATCAPAETTTAIQQLFEQVAMRVRTAVLD